MLTLIFQKIKNWYFNLCNLKSKIFHRSKTSTRDLGLRDPQLKI